MCTANLLEGNLDTAFVWSIKEKTVARIKVVVWVIHILTSVNLLTNVELTFFVECNIAGSDRHADCKKIKHFTNISWVLLLWLVEQLVVSIVLEFLAKLVDHLKVSETGALVKPLNTLTVEVYVVRNDLEVDSLGGNSGASNKSEGRELHDWVCD